MAQNKSCYSKWEGRELGKEGLGKTKIQVGRRWALQLRAWDLGSAALAVFSSGSFHLGHTGPLSCSLSTLCEVFHGLESLGSSYIPGLHCDWDFLLPVSLSGFSGPPFRDFSPFAPCQVLAAYWNLGTSLYGPITLAFSIWPKGYQVAAAKITQCYLPITVGVASMHLSKWPGKTFPWIDVFESGRPSNNDISSVSLFK